MQGKNKILKEWVSAFKDASVEGRKQVISQLLEVNQKTGEITINDGQLLMIYLEVSRRFYWLLGEDLNNEFVLLVLEALEAIEIHSTKTDKEYTNGQIIEYFKRYINNKFIDLTRTWDLHNKMEGLESGQFEGDSPYCPYYKTDKKSFEEHNAIENDTPIRLFIDDVDIQTKLHSDPKQLQLYNILANDASILPDSTSVRDIANVLDIGKSSVHRRKQKLETTLQHEFDNWYDYRGKHLASSNLTYIIEDFLSHNKYSFDDIFEFISNNYILKKEEFEEVDDQEALWEKLTLNKPDYTYTMINLLEDYMNDRDMFITLWRCLKYNNTDWLSTETKQKIAQCALVSFRKYINN